MSSFDSWTEGKFEFTPSIDYTEKMVLSEFGNLRYDPVLVIDHVPLAAAHCTDRPIKHFTFSAEQPWVGRSWFAEMVNEEGCTILDAVQALTTGQSMCCFCGKAICSFVSRHQR